MKGSGIIRSILSIATAASLTLLASAAQGQNLLTNGDFESGATGWTTFGVGAANGDSTIDFTYTGAVPTGGSGQCVRITSPLTDQGIAFYQSFTATAGDTYYLFLRSKDLASGAAGAWMEAYINHVAPTPGSDYTANKMSVFNTWNCDDWDGSNLTACEYRRLAFTVPTSGTYYVVIKGGTCCGQIGDIVIDDVSVTQATIGPDLLTNGAFGSATGWTAFNQTTNTGETINLDFNSSANVPFGASGTCLRLTQSGGFRNGGIYQAVNVTAGTTYALYGYARDNGSADAWGEFQLTTTQPTDGNDVNGNFLGFNTYGGCSNWDGDMGIDCATGNDIAVSVTADTTGTAYLVLKAGCNTTLDMSFDDLELREVTPPAGTGVADWNSY